MLNGSYNKSLPRYWLLLGTFAVAIAGLFSLVLVAARTPSLAKLPAFNALFHQALVVHVDLSVLVWFLCIACMLWGMILQNKPQPFAYLEEGALVCFLLGIIGITISPLNPNGEALMSNYIPVLHTPLFFIGLLLLGCGMALMLLKLCLSLAHFKTRDSLYYALIGAALVAWLSLIDFWRAYNAMPSVIDGTQYYELLFWGGGHVLQFLHVQILIIAWWLVVTLLKPSLAIPRPVLLMLFSISPVGALIMQFAPFDDISSADYRQFYTDIMIGLNGLAPAAFAAIIIPTLWQARSQRKGVQRALWSGIVMSVLLFIYGGVLGWLIQGQNVVIPAHYHGSIVGITLAFMTLAYAFLPWFGYRDVSSWKLSYWQPIVYGLGQIMHISGLAYSGGYGVLRKTPGAINEISPAVKAAMGFMGLGGLLAIIGGLMFVVVIAKAIRKTA